MRAFIGLTVAVLVAATGSAGADTDLSGPAAETTRVNVSSSGTQGDLAGHSASAISSDGRFVAFDSHATNLVPGDTKGARDVFVHDRQYGTTERVSINEDRRQGNGASKRPSISADGRFVAFTSAASNLVPNDTNQTADVFVFDREANTIERVSVRSNGRQGKSHSFSASISADGRFVAFASYAPNLVFGDRNGHSDIFVRDRLKDATRRVSLSSSGNEGRGDSFAPSMSADGRFVAFSSLSESLVPEDGNHRMDIFVRDRLLKSTERVSVGSAGTESDGRSYEPSISGTGRYVAFTSESDDLVPGDMREIDVFVRDREMQTTLRVSEGPGGSQGNHESYSPSISGDGRWVVFESYASDLIEGDTNDHPDIYLHDLETGGTERVSVGPDACQADEWSFLPAISKDGRFVVFTSFADNLVLDDTNHKPDVFVRGPVTEVTEPLVAGSEGARDG